MKEEIVKDDGRSIEILTNSPITRKIIGHGPRKEKFDTVMYCGYPKSRRSCWMPLASLHIDPECVWSESFGHPAGALQRVSNHFF